MDILYIAKHSQPNSNDDEGAIAYALQQLGHHVEIVQESKGYMMTKLCRDIVLFHKWDGIVDFPDRMKKICWYFDLVQSPDRDETLASRDENRKAWMRKVLPRVDLIFCSDGDWVSSCNEYELSITSPNYGSRVQPNSKKLVHLTQGADERIIGLAKPRPDLSIPILFTGLSRRAGILRTSFVNDLMDRYRDKVVCVERGVYREELASLISSSNIVVAPDYPVTDSYWSNRVYLTLGFGGFLLHPYCEKLTEHYKNNKEIVYYHHNRKELYGLIDYYIDHPIERNRIANAGLIRTQKQHTYRHRCIELLRVVKERLF